MEQEVVASRNGHWHAPIKLSLTHQPLHTMGLSEAEIDALPASAVITTDKDIFAELSTAWIEVAVALATFHSPTRGGRCASIEDHGSC